MKCVLFVQFYFSFMGFVDSNEDPESNSTLSWVGNGKYEYYFAAEKVNQSEAAAHCKQMSATLASVHSDTEALFIESALKHRKTNESWIGLRIDKPSPKCWACKDGTNSIYCNKLPKNSSLSNMNVDCCTCRLQWHWLDQTESTVGMQYMNWHTFHPTRDSACAILWYSYRWMETNCSDKHGFVCKRNIAPSQPPSTESSGIATPSHSSLPTMIIIIIGVSMGVGVLILVGGVSTCFVCRRRKSKSKPRSVPSQQDSHIYYNESAALLNPLRVNNNAFNANFSEDGRENLTANKPISISEYELVRNVQVTVALHGEKDSDACKDNYEDVTFAGDNHTKESHTKVGISEYDVVRLPQGDAFGHEPKHTDFHDVPYSGGTSLQADPTQTNPTRKTENDNGSKGGSKAFDENEVYAGIADCDLDNAALAEGQIRGAALHDDAASTGYSRVGDVGPRQYPANAVSGNDDYAEVNDATLDPLPASPAAKTVSPPTMQKIGNVTNQNKKGGKIPGGSKDQTGAKAVAKVPTEEELSAMYAKLMKKSSSRSNAARTKVTNKADLPTEEKLEAMYAHPMKNRDKIPKDAIYVEGRDTTKP